MLVRALLAMTFLFASLASWAAGGPVLVTQAYAVASSAPRFPAHESVQMVELPDDWSRTRPRYDGTVWYRVQFDRPGDMGADLLALYVGRACTNLDVVLNGSLIYNGGGATAPRARHCLHPQIVTMPSGLLLEHGNVLDLRVQGMALQRVGSLQRSAGLSTVLIGKQADLAPLQASGMFWNIEAVRLLSATLVLLGVFMLNLFRMNKGEVYLFYFGALLLGWAVLSARVWWIHPPLDPDTLELLIGSAYAPVLAFGVQFLLSYAGLRSRIIEAVLVLQCVAMPISLVLAGPQRMFLAVSAWQGVVCVEMCAAIALYLVMVRKGRPKDFWPMLLILLVAAMSMLYQLAAQYQIGDLPTIPTLHLVMPLVLLAIGGRLMQLFARALQAAEASRSTLESRVKEATAEIERNFAQLAELRVEQVTEKERKRIAGDLHDDLGAKLLTIIHTSESERIATLAREALEEMRLSVRGLTGRPVRLTDAFADWRNEVVLRLGQANIEADWRGPIEDTEQLLPARAYVQTTRIFREAVSNIIKHSGASLCQVTSSVGERDFIVTIQDNGRGIPMELDGNLDRGHGMSSMKHRAKQLQGQCLVESGPGYGTVIRLTLPL